MHEAATVIYIIHTVPAVLDSRDDVGKWLESVSTCVCMNTVHAKAAMSLPAVLVGPGDGPGSKGGPVPAVPGNEAGEWGMKLSLSPMFPLFNPSC